MRKAIWPLLRSRIPEGQILPTWAIALRAVLFPLEFFHWYMTRARGYQFESDTWLIHGVRYSDRALHRLSKSNGEIYRINRTGDVVTLEVVEANSK